MKKILPFIRSMRFGMMLLLPVLLCTVLGSVVPQGESESYYAETFPGLYHLILGLGLHRVFSGWFFLLLTALFGVNLAFCSASQLRSVPGREAAAIKKAETVEIAPAEDYSADKLTGYFRRHGWKRVSDGERSVFISHPLSWYGSVITHFALLGVLLGAAGIFGLSRTADYNILPGDNAIAGGIIIRLEDFQITDESGRIDYASTLEVIAPNGKSSGVRQIRVNKPLRFGANKYYQQSYGVSGEVTVTVKATGEVKPLHMTEQGVISVGGADGIWYNNVYPAYVEDADGSKRVIIESMTEYPDPIYYVVRLVDGGMEPILVLPGESVETGDAVYTFDVPAYYPGVRVKTTPVSIYALLYASFALLVAGLYLCFFAPAAVVAVGKKGFAIVSRKGETELKQRFSTLL